MKLRVPVFVKIITPLVLIITFSIGISGYRVYQTSVQRWQSEMDRRLARVAVLVAQKVDVEALGQVQKPTDIDSRAYISVADFLEQTAIAANIDWIGIYYRKGDYLYYWVDSDYTGVGYPFFYATEQHFAALKNPQVDVGTAQATLVQYTDEFGSYYGFVAPIVAYAGGQPGSVMEGVDPVVVGVVEASLSYEASHLLEQRILSRVLPVLIGGIVVAIGAAMLVTLIVFYRPLQQLQRGALELFQGNFGYVIPLTSQDEMGDLATTFNRMSVEMGRLYGKLQAYNQELEGRVKARTAELREERNRLNTILQNIADGLVVTDATGQIVLANPAFAQIVGQSVVQIAEQMLSEVLPSEDLNTLVVESLAQPEQVLVTNLSWKSLAVGARPRVYKAVACALVEREEGDESALDPPEVLGTVTVLHDVTHETEVDQMKTDFISTVSHELRTPLTSVLGFTKLIQKTFERKIAPLISDEDTRDQRAVQRIRDNLDIIIAESERLTRLINDVLDIAKIEAGKVEWHIDPVHIVEVIRSATAATAALATEKGLSVGVDIEPGLPLVRADKDRMIQVLTNLLSNAIKFTDRGYIHVRARQFTIGADASISPSLEFMGPAKVSIQALQSLEPGPWLAVSVEDTGVGIASDNLQKVFEKFRQVGDVITGRPKGTGLGLSISREIVEYHGGRIWVVSRLGEGSTFTFVLPLLASMSSQPPIIEGVRSRLDKVLTAQPAESRILVVDDEANIRELLYQELTDAGYQVLQATNGVDALQVARNECPNLIILDLMMPGLNGFDVISALRSDPSTSAIPILILSVLEDREKGYRLGADAYLTKPLNAPEVLGTIEALLDRAARGEGRKKVLVIDEDTSVVETLTRVFQEKGYEVVGVSNHREGLSRAREERPRFIILDAVISKMNNYEILRTLKCASETQSAHIIVISVQDSPLVEGDEEIAELLKLGVDYCTLPDELEELLSGIKDKEHD